MAISDPVADFSGLFYWGGEEFVEAVLETYHEPVTDGLLGTARYLAVCRGAGDVVFGLERGRAEYIEAGLRALDLCIAI